MHSVKVHYTVVETIYKLYIY